MDIHVLDDSGQTVDVSQVPPDADALRVLASRLGERGQPIHAAIESMTGARFVHDQLRTPAMVLMSLGTVSRLNLQAPQGAR